MKLARILTRLPDPPPRQSQTNADDDEELDESDVVWSSSLPLPLPETQTQTLTPSPTTTTGISAALFSSSPSTSPSIQHRKTTSSPISMIPSKSSTGPVFGRNFQSQFHQSAPVKVPVWPGGSRGVRPGPFDEMDGEDGWLDDDEGIVPPHEIVARSQKTTTFSVVEGAGRTLKGRDLTATRNAVFHKTGFLQ